MCLHEVNELADNFRFTGPKITLSGDELTDEQQEALKVEGLSLRAIAAQLARAASTVSSATET